jgi:hypothetical protein
MAEPTFIDEDESANPLIDFANRLLTGALDYAQRPSYNYPDTTRTRKFQGDLEGLLSAKPPPQAPIPDDVLNALRSLSPDYDETGREIFDKYGGAHVSPVSGALDWKKRPGRSLGSFLERLGGIGQGPAGVRSIKQAQMQEGRGNLMAPVERFISQNKLQELHQAPVRQFQEQQKEKSGILGSLLRSEQDVLGTLSSANTANQKIYQDELDRKQKDKAFERTLAFKIGRETSREKLARETLAWNNHFKTWQQNSINAKTEAQFEAAADRTVREMEQDYNEYIDGFTIDYNTYAGRGDSVKASLAMSSINKLKREKMLMENKIREEARNDFIAKSAPPSLPALSSPQKSAPAAVGQDEDPKSAPLPALSAPTSAPAGPPQVGNTPAANKFLEKFGGKKDSKAPVRTDRRSYYNKESPKSPIEIQRLKDLKQKKWDDEYDAKIKKLTQEEKDKIFGSRGDI